MPTVRRYDSPQVRQAPLPGVRISPETGGAFSRPQPVDFSAPIDLIAKIHEQEIEKADQVATLDADAKMAKAETDFLYGENGVLNREGQNAFGAPEEIQEAWNKAVSEIDKGLKSDRQKMAFRRSMEQRWQSVNNTVQRHVATERKRYDDTTTKSFLENERNAAVANFSDPERVSLSLTRQVAAIKDFAKRNGLSSDATEAAVSEAVSKTHLGVINRMEALDQDLQASAYYKQHKDQIAGTDRANVEQSLQEGSLRGESQRKADEIMKKYGSESEAIAAVKDIEDPKIRDAVQQRVEHEWGQKRQRQREEENDLYVKAGNMIDAKPGQSARRVVPPHIWNNLSVSQKGALEAYAKRNDPSEGGDGEGSQNNKLYLEFLDKTPEELGKMNQSEFASKYWQHFDKSHRGKAETDWKNARDAARKPSAAVHLTSARSFRQMVTDGLQKSRLVDKSKRPSQLTQGEASLPASVYDEAADMLEEFQAAKGKPADPVEKQKIVDNVILSRAFATEGRKTIDVMDRGRKVAQIVKESNGILRVPFGKVPESERESIRRRITQTGGKVTRDKVERGYAAAVMGDTETLNAIVREK